MIVEGERQNHTIWKKVTPQLPRVRPLAGALYPQGYVTVPCMGKAITDSGLEELSFETQMDFASRLCALEYFTCHVLAMALPATIRDPVAIDGMHRRMLSELSPKNAARVSDTHAEMAMSELEYAIRRLISLQRDMLGIPRRLRP